MANDAFYGNLARYYDFICSDRKGDVAVLRKLIAKHKRSSEKSLLDVACGTGLEDKYLKEYFGVTGLDLHEGVLKLARKRNPKIRYEKGNMMTFRLKTKFDVILCFDAMCYLRNQKELTRTLSNFFAHLKPGGVLIFYIDDTFLRGKIKSRTRVIVDRRSTKSLDVTLMLLHRQLKAGVLTQDIFLIREKGKSKIIIEPEETLGLFEEKKVLETLRTIGLRTHRYCTTNRTTFSLRKYQGKGTPVFVCEKPL